ncbi:MAG: DUF3373 family protein [Deltaproteobacteria bacterium]|nr:DUF3373 family protein [Deltaproteobacteria bacterium]
MKRILMAVFAVAVAAAWAVPSYAGEVTLSGEYRLRAEKRGDADFDENTKDSTDMWGQRVRLTANAKATDDTSVKITLQDTRTWGATQAKAGGPGLTDGAAATTTGTLNALDLHESYVNIANIAGQPVTVKLGRQELVYGDQRLIGAFGWSNNGRSFDALKLVYTHDAANVDLFTSKVRDSLVSGTDQDFNGLYATIKKLPVPNTTIDFYYLQLKDGQTAQANPFGIVGLGNTAVAGALIKPQKLNTYGVRLKGAVAGLDYTLELPFQSGTVETTTKTYKMSGSAFAGKAGYNIPGAPMKLRAGAEYDYASGDKDGTDEKVKTFFNLFPTNHDKLGYMDLVAWRNIKAWNLNGSIEPMDNLKLLVSYWNFKLAAKEDGWYGAGNWNNAASGGIMAARAANAKVDIGSEIDIVVSHKLNSAVSCELGLSRFMIGAIAKDYFATTATTEKETDQDWAYVSLTATF